MTAVGYCLVAAGFALGFILGDFYRRKQQKGDDDAVLERLAVTQAQLANSRTQLIGALVELQKLKGAK